MDASVMAMVMWVAASHTGGLTALVDCLGLRVGKSHLALSLHSPHKLRELS